MQESNTIPSRSVTAAVSFSRAIRFYEATGDIERVCDLEANIFWCKKRMNIDDVKTFLALKGNDKSVTEALAKADAVASKEIPKTEANNYFDRAEKYSKEHPEDYEQIAVHYFEVAERFVGTDTSLVAQKLSLQAQQQQMKQIQAAKESERQTLFSKSSSAALAAHQLAAIPAPDVLRTSVAAVRKLYKENYAKTKPSQKGRLATKILNLAQDSKDDPVTQFALLTEAIDLAIGVGDLYIPFIACDVMAQNFIGIDAKAKKKEVYSKAHATPTVQSIIKLLDNPEDADANSIVGKYFCLEVGNWAVGLPLLAHGGDADFKAAADMEMLKPLIAPEQIELADKWYALGKKAKGSAQDHLLARAAFWLRQAEPLLTGITKDRESQRLDEIYRQVPETDIDYNHITVKQWERLLPRSIDVSATSQTNDIGLALTKGMRLRIVPHPADVWTMRYEQWTWNNGQTGTFDTDAAGFTTTLHDHRFATAMPTRWIGAMVVTVGTTGMLSPQGEISGEGKVMVGPYMPSGGSGGVGRIRIKIILLEEE